MSGCLVCVQRQQGTGRGEKGKGILGAGGYGGGERRVVLGRSKKGEKETFRGERRKGKR